MSEPDPEIQPMPEEEGDESYESEKEKFSISNGLPCLVVRVTDSVNGFIKNEVVVQASGFDSPDARHNFDHAFAKSKELRRDKTK